MVDTDHEHMLRAIELAAGVRASTSPNPWVGCVLVAADGRAPEGAPPPPGGSHAEAAALAEAATAGIDTRGATAYVTLEPCNHQRRPPPSAHALIAAGPRYPPRPHPPLRCRPHRRRCRPGRRGPRRSRPARAGPGNRAAARRRR